MANSDHASAVRSAVVTIDKVQEELDSPRDTEVLDWARQILHEYQEGLEVDDA